jgi:hypothetical protein
MVQVRQQSPSLPESGGFYGEYGGGYPYPGLGNPYDAGRSMLPVPYSPQTPTTIGGGNGGGGGGGGGLFGSSLNLGQIKGFVDKMGGIDGIMGTMTRVQKMVSSFQQMAPMLKLLMGSFGGKAAAKSLSDDRGRYRRKRTKGRRKSRTGRKPVKRINGTVYIPKSSKGKKRR